MLIVPEMISLQISFLNVRRKVSWTIKTNLAFSSANMLERLKGDSVNSDKLREWERIVLRNKRTWGDGKVIDQSTYSCSWSDEVQKDLENIGYWQEPAQNEAMTQFGSLRYRCR